MTDFSECTIQYGTHDRSAYVPISCRRLSSINVSHSLKTTSAHILMDYVMPNYLVRRTNPTRYTEDNVNTNTSFRNAGS